MTNKCNECGAVDYSTKYIDCPEKAAMDAYGVCFKCGFWLVIVAEKAPLIIVDNFAYMAGDEGASAMFRGFGGRRFDFERFDGRRGSSTNMWARGEVPKCFRERLPDNARFLNGAERCEVGGMTCWDSSSEAEL